MDEKMKAEAPEKMSINFNLKNPFFIGGMVILVLLVICMFVYVFSDDKESKGILIIGTPEPELEPEPEPEPELEPEPEPEPSQNDTDEKQCVTVSDCVGREKLEELYRDSGSFNDEQMDCLNTDEPYCLLETCLYPYKGVGEECGVGKECNSNHECTTITNIDLTNCQGDSEIFMPFHEWVNRLTDPPGGYSAGDTMPNVFNREIDKIVEYELDYHNKPLESLRELRDSSDEVKHGQIALARYMLKDIKGISNKEISTTITGGWDDYNDLLDPSDIGFNGDSTTITKLEVDYCSKIPHKNNLVGSLPLYDLVSSRLNPEWIVYLNESNECNKKIIDVDDTIKEQTCTTDSNDGITCQYDSENDSCLPTTSTPNSIDNSELANSLQSFDHCKAYYSKEGYNCIEDEGSFLSFGGLLHVCKNDDKCV